MRKNKNQAAINTKKDSVVEPIAIIGISCRFPGGVNDTNSFWKLLLDGVDAIKEVPKDRWNIKEYYDPDPDKPGKMYTKWGGFLEQDISQFDAKFFGLSHSEAQAIDPQQRLVLEVGWEALENASLNPMTLAGSRTGVFIGVFTHDYDEVLSIEPLLTNSFSNLGTASGLMSGRLSHFLDLRGPSLSIDTASSASLVAVHQACESLRSGESELAISGGVNLVLSPKTTIGFCRSGALAIDGRCKSFDKSANGYVRGEGCGILVLKRLSDALANNDPIRAVIIGSAVNQDGRTPTIMAPNQAAQEALIQDAIDSAGIDASQVGYIEAHGTGTPLGDAAEAGAIVKVFKGKRNSPLVLGSVKTNIGHLESAAGIAGLIKSVLILENKMIPKNLNFIEPNPALKLNSIPAVVATELTPWRKHESHPRIAGVSSFGMTGTNAHILLQEAPQLTAEQAPKTFTERPLHLLCLSALNNLGLNELAGKYAQHLTHSPHSQFADICYSANQGRAQFNERLVVIAETSERAINCLKAFSAGIKKPGLLQRTLNNDLDQQQVTFLFSGQGSQYFGMGQDLYKTQPTFMKVVDDCAKILSRYLPLPLLSVLWGENKAKLNETKYTQAALFTIEYALSELWKSWGIEPSAVMGHSVGELVAACVAGVFSLEDGLKLIAKRGELMQKLDGDCGMGAVSASGTEAEAAIKSYGSNLSIAAYNGPTNTTISGDKKSLREVLAKFEKDGFKVKELSVSHGFHSSQMDPALQEFEKTANEIRYFSPKIKLISNLTGKEVSGNEVIDAAYWRKHAREAVKFEQGIKTLWEQGFRNYIEIGPGTTLVGMAQQSIVNGELGSWTASIKQDRKDWDQLLESMGTLYLRGLNINWTKFESETASRKKLSLPSYPFQKQSYWTQGLSPGVVPKGPRQFKRTILGFRIQSFLFKNKEIVYESRYSLNNFSFLGQGKIYQAPLVPSSAFLAQVAQTAKEIFGEFSFRIEDFCCEEPLYLTKDENKAVQLIVSMHGQEKFSFQIASLSQNSGKEDTWLSHAHGTVQNTLVPLNSNPQVNLENYRKLEPQISSVNYKSKLQEMGYGKDQNLNWIEYFWCKNNKLFAEFFNRVPETEKNEFHIHPGLIESCFYSMVLGLLNSTKTKYSEAFIPSEIKSLEFFGNQTGNLICQLSSAEKNLDVNELQGDLQITDERGHLILKVEGMKLRSLSRSSIPKELIEEKSSDLVQDSKTLWERIEDAPLTDRKDIIENFIELEVILQMGLDSDKKINRQLAFKLQGVDSLRAVELRKQLKLALGNSIEIPSTVVLDYPNVEALGQFILNQFKVVQLRPEIIDEQNESSSVLNAAAMNTDMELILQEELEAVLRLRKA